MIIEGVMWQDYRKRPLGLWFAPMIYTPRTYDEMAIAWALLNELPKGKGGRK